jgi:hypothetical protein
MVPPDGRRDARDSGHAPSAAGTHRLSMVHKTRTSTKEGHKAKKALHTFEVWERGSLAIFPGIPNHDPKANKSDQSPGGLRGKVTSLSDASRRNLMKYLATLDRDASLYTMALTLPGDVSQITSPIVHEAFKKLCNRFTASEKFPDVGFVWKRELQKRGVLHYHLIVAGLNEEEGPTPKSLQAWIAYEWNQLVCEGIDPEGKCQHWLWHCHSKNMERVFGNIHGYFAKYVGKPLENVHEEIPGRWWGKVNTKALPVAEKKEIAMPERAAILAHRVARKIAKKRANAAKHYRICKDLGLLDIDKKAFLSEFALIAAMHRTLPRGEKGRHDEMMFCAKEKGKRWGKAKTPKFVRFQKVKLISRHSPDTSIRIMRYTVGALRDWLERHPF